LSKAIVGIEIAVDRLEGKWKLSQNRSAADQRGVIAGLEQLDCYAASEMANIMRRGTSPPDAEGAVKKPTD
jgi:transcriptional regulator